MVCYHCLDEFPERLGLVLRSALAIALASRPLDQYAAGIVIFFS